MPFSRVGTSTAALCFGGHPPFKNETEVWNGTAWTEVNNLNTARRALSGGGTATSALAFGGIDSSGDTAKNEVWNGTSWSEDGDLGTGYVFGLSFGKLWFRIWGT